MKRVTIFWVTGSQSVVPRPVVSTSHGNLLELFYVLDIEQQTVSKSGKEYIKGAVLSPCLFNFYAEYIMRNARLDEAQAGIKITGRNINNLRYADDTTLMAESEEELKSLLMKMKEESEKVGLKLNILSFKILSFNILSLVLRKLRSWHLVPSLHANRWENSGNSG